MSKKSHKLVNLIDLCGHEKYLKTTMLGLVGYLPDYILIVIGANFGLSKMTKAIDSKHKMHPVSIGQRILSRLVGSSMQYPVRCGVCGVKTKGNIVIGYRMGCDCMYGVR